MSQRNVNVVHVFARRNFGSVEQFLLYSHDRWSSTPNGTPFLTVPTKKVLLPRQGQVNAHAVRMTCAAVLNEDLGGEMSLPRRLNRRPPMTLDMVSPTQRQLTTYNVFPVFVPVEPRRDNRLSKRIHGQWLSVPDALNCPQLSPTARRVFEVLWADREPMPSGALRHCDEWTRQLVAAQSGQPNLFGPLFEEMKPWLTERLRICAATRYLVHSPHDLDDVLQMVAINALTHLRSFDARRGSAGLWLWALSRNCAVSHLRRCLVRSTHSLFAQDGNEFAVVDPNPGPAACAESNEEVQKLLVRVESALESCGPKVRRAWEMRIHEGKTYADIAETMDAPPGTVATWIFRVKNIIHESMEREQS